MKRFNYIVAALLVFLVGCSNEDLVTEQGGEGTLALKVNMENRVQIASRSVDLTPEAEQVLLENCKIRIFDGTKLVRKFKGVSELPQEGIQLVSGHYTATIQAGDSVAASFEKQYYQGSKDFDITQGGRTQVDLKGYIRNAVVKVVFDAASMDEVYSDYQVEIGPEGAMLAYTKADAANQRGYYMLSEGVDKFGYTLTTTTTNGETKKYTGEALKNVKPATLYTVNFRYTQADVTVGGAYINIEVEEEPLDAVDAPIMIYQRPVYTGLYDDNSKFNINSPLTLEPNYARELSMWVAFSAPITEMTMTCDDFASWGVSQSAKIDLKNLSASERESLAAKGVNYITRNVVGEGAIVGIDFSVGLVSKITAQEGTHMITFDARDNKGGQRILNWVVNISNSTVVTETANELDVYATHAIIRGSVSKEPTGMLSFQYREVGSPSWLSVPAERLESALSAQLKNLKSGTVYEYRVLDGETPSSIISKFTTEFALQPENAGFEDWSGNSPLYLCAEGQERWWDSGNHGSASMGKNVTYNTSDYKHSGNYAAKLASQFVGIGVIGKFAAGNAFVGKYIRTDGTDGVLGWGRPFASRPVALRGYIKYVSAQVNHACDFIQNGQPDQGQIFVALGDWAGETDGETWPVIVRTKDKHLFDQTRSNKGTIAYGQQTWTESTTGEGLIEFTIPLEYWRTDAKPKTLVLVCTASKYGDYFAGGEGSTMWIDDFEFVYE